MNDECNKCHHEVFTFQWSLQRSPFHPTILHSIMFTCNSFCLHDLTFSGRHSSSFLLQCYRVVERIIISLLTLVKHCLKLRNSDIRQSMQNIQRKIVSSYNSYLNNSHSIVCQYFIIFTTGEYSARICNNPPVIVSFYVFCDNKFYVWSKCQVMSFHFRSLSINCNLTWQLCLLSCWNIVLNV